MQKHPTKIPGVYLLEPQVHSDGRGYFKEVYSAERYAALGLPTAFVQDNVSHSRAGVLRGMHYDLRMEKLVECLHGGIYDVVADMRPDSPAFKKWLGVELSGQNHRQIYVPAGCAHGFYVTSPEGALVHYKQSAAYDPALERVISWRDAELAIAWPLRGEPVLSGKDAAA